MDINNMDTKKESFIDRFILRGTAKVLIYIYQHPYSFNSDISKKLNITYSYIVIITNRLIEEGIIKKDKKGRKTIIILTLKGESLAKHLVKIKEMEK